jgi:NAD-dependent deacetylase
MVRRAPGESPRGCAEPRPFRAGRIGTARARIFLATQNVDGLHQRAGSRNVVELHGNITRTKCFEENVIVDQWEDTGEVPPRCPRCGGRLRPDVVWFEEMLPEEEFEKALEASRVCEFFFSIGTSSLVYPVARCCTTL